MKHLIHNAEGFKVEVKVTKHPRIDPTVEFISTWPKANHPEPHKLLSLTLPPESFAQLANILQEMAATPNGEK